MRVLPQAGAPLDLRLVPAALAAWLVAWQGRLLPPRLLLAAALVLALLAAGLLVRRATVAAAVLGCAAASAVVTGLHVESRTTGPLATAAQQRAAVTVEAVLTDDPRRAASDPELVVVRLRVDELRAAGRVHRLRAPVVAALVRARRGSSCCPASASGRRDGCGRRSAGTTSPRCCRAAASRRCCRRPRACSGSPGHLRAGLRRAVDPLPPAERGLLPGLVVGDTSRLDSRTCARTSAPSG